MGGALPLPPPNPTLRAPICTVIITENERWKPRDLVPLSSAGAASYAFECSSSQSLRGGRGSGQGWRGWRRQCCPAPGRRRR